MSELRERILNCKTAVELNSLRMLLVKDAQANIGDFKENQSAFIKMKNKLKRVPHSERGENFGNIYDPTVKQQEA